MTLLALARTRVAQIRGWRLACWVAAVAEAAAVVVCCVSSRVLQTAVVGDDRQTDRTIAEKEARLLVAGRDGVGVCLRFTPSSACQPCPRIPSLHLFPLSLRGPLRIPHRITSHSRQRHKTNPIALSSEHCYCRSYVARRSTKRNTTCLLARVVNACSCSLWR
jgi:hypothetical protein